MLMGTLFSSCPSVSYRGLISWLCLVTSEICAYDAMKHIDLWTISEEFHSKQTNEIRPSSLENSVFLSHGAWLVFLYTSYNALWIKSKLRDCCSMIETSRTSLADRLQRSIRNHYYYYNQLSCVSRVQFTPLWKFICLASQIDNNKIGHSR